MLAPGDVVLCDFVGAQGTKWRPAVVISTALYLANGIDVVVGELTTQLQKASLPTSYALQDWSAAGLHQRSVFRCYFSMAIQADCQPVGRLSDRDWQEVQARLRLALAVT
jgi:mRNA-degrading endonuclease toxin of MazEF toxin-antitoxin module